MKKNLFYLFALICSMSLFTACSDDDDNTWQQYKEVEYKGDGKLEIVTNGENQGTKYGVTFNATSETEGTLTFEKIVNVANDFVMPVSLARYEDGFKVQGTKDLRAGFTVTVQGTILTAGSTLEVKTSGYDTFNKSYSGASLVAKFNTVAVLPGMLTSPAVDFKPVSSDKATISLKYIIPGVYEMDKSGGNSGLVIENAAYTLTQKDGKDVCSFEGNATYNSSKITYKGAIADGILTLDVTQNIESPVVAAWKMKMLNQQMADVIFDFQSATGKIVFPDEIMALIPENMQGIIKKEMTDAEISGFLKTLLGQYAGYLQALDLKATGDITATIVTIGNETAEPSNITGLINYIIKDNKFSLVPNISALMGMMPASSKAYNPATLFQGDGVPFNFTATGSTLELSLNQEVVGPLLGFVPIIISMAGLDEQTLAMILPIIQFVDANINGVDENGDGVYEMQPCKKFEVGLKFTK